MLATLPIFSQDAAADDVRAASCPKRADLIRLTEPEGLTRVHLQIHRNYAFEFVGSVLPPFLWMAGIKPVIDYGSYDDSLSFSQLDPIAIQIITLDFERYGDQACTREFGEWFSSRLGSLRGKTEAAIIVSDWPTDHDSAQSFNLELEKAADRLPSVFVWKVSEICRQIAAEFFDVRAAGAKGTRLSDRACIELARDLGLVRLPSALRPRIKAVVVDLDHTLYDGVLGEDGIQGIHITESHTAIYKELLRLREEGIFLAVLSKNDERDFAGLCAARPDFLLRPEHFSASSIGWESKAEGLARIAEQLRIAPDAMLVIDDNPAEIEQIRAAHDTTHLLHARSAAQTLFWLRHYPTLNGYRVNESNTLRLSDLEASKYREQLRTSTSSTDYVREMQVELSYALNPIGSRRRLSELSQKTNQFNTGLERFSEVEVERRLTTPEHWTIAIGMRDRLCDSGNIGAIFARAEGDCLVIDEICVSCRALGRNIESSMVALALAPIMQQQGLSNVAFNFREGPRNLPARMWLASFTREQEIPKDGRVSIAWEHIPQLNEHLSTPIVSKWEQHQ